MAVGVILEFKGATTEQYNKVIELIGPIPCGPGGPGGRFHLVTRTDTGLRVAEVMGVSGPLWRFVQEKIGRQSQAVASQAGKGPDLGSVQALG